MNRVVLGIGLVAVAVAAVGACGGSETSSSAGKKTEASHTSKEPTAPIAETSEETAVSFTSEDADRLKALIDENPEESVRLLEQIVAASVVSLSDEQFEELRVAMTELVDRERIRRLVRAGREYPATNEQVAQLIDDLEAWDAAIIRGADHWGDDYR